MSHGSASLIAPRSAITAAHNLFSRRQMKEYASWTFVSGTRRTRISNFWFPKAYAEDQDEDYDVIELEAALE